MRFIASTVLVLIAIASVHGDGGTLRTSQKSDTRLISVFTSPTPPCAGLIDISVLVQDAATGRVLLDVPTRVRARKGSMKPLEAPATSEAATNKLMRAALLDLPQPGTWTIDVLVADEKEPLQFELTVQEAPPAWREMILWICWPLAAITLFVLLQWRNLGGTPFGVPQGVPPKFHPSGVKPSTTSNRAATSLIREFGTAAKSTINDSRAR